MKLKISDKISFEEADVLIEKYYEGYTNIEEEKRLQKFLLRSNLPERYKPEQAIFGYFKKDKVRKKMHVYNLLQYAAVVALLVMGGVSVEFFISKKQTNYVFVDGLKISDESTIKAQALASLNEISAANMEVEESINGLNCNDIIQQQFAEFE